MQKVLVVDDEVSIRWSLGEFLKEKEFEVFNAVSGKEAIEQTEKVIPNLVLLDLNLPDIAGLDILKKIKEINSNIQIIIITGQGDVSSAVEAMQIGAFHYIEKPFNLETLYLIIKNALEAQLLKKEVQGLKIQQKRTWQNKILGKSQAMLDIFNLVDKVAKSKAATVLLTGESGTGKGMIARAVHDSSSRKKMPFVDINCTALPETLLESELFGHEKGAFTDARKTKQGLFEIANDGTLFLDEIGDMSLMMQAKLLKAIEEKSFKRVGGIKNIHVDVRIIASTNRDLQKCVLEKTFREDLYYRLKVIPIFLPPLRERSQDIEELAKYFLDVFNKEFGLKILSFHPEALKLLYNYNWPGNIRELKNVIERVVILSTENIVQPENLLLDGINTKIKEKSLKNEVSADIKKNNDNNIKQEKTLDEIEKEAITSMLTQHNWNRNKVAIVLNINRTTLYKKIRKYGIESV